ncbi:MAG: hypothetical protein ACFFER_02675 [Candidatus Thorarchaeota archaeon]
MSVIEGRENILDYWQRQLNQAWTNLERKHGKEPVRRNILLALLYMINYKHRPRMENLDNPNSQIGEELAQFRVLLGTLDELLRRGWNRLESLQIPNNVQTFEDIVWRDFQVLGHLRNMHSVALISKRKSMRVFADEEERNVHMSKTDAAFAEWQGSYRLDGEWIEYYHNESRLDERIRTLVKAEVEEKYGFSQNRLIYFNKIIAGLIQRSIEWWMQGGNSIITWKHIELLDMLRQEYQYAPAIDSSTASAFLEEIEYSPDRSWARSPFVKIDMIQDTIYVPVHYFLYPPNIFASAWIDYIIERGSAIGTIGREWGVSFEKYVRTELAKFHPHLNVEASNIILNSTTYPDIRDCLGEIGKSQIEIDVIAHTIKKLYLISCKSMGSYTAPDMLKNLSLLDFHDLETQTDQDFDMTGEIEDYAKCVKQSNTFLKSSGFEGLEIVPILITATFRPLCLESVQELFADYRIIPSVRIIQAMRLSEAQFN